MHGRQHWYGRGRLRSALARVALLAWLANLMLAGYVTRVGAGSVTLGAVLDNTLYESTDGSLSNGAGAFLFAGRTLDDHLRRALLRFNVSGGVPAEMRITSARLRLHVSRSHSTDKAMTLHRLNNSWGEGASNAASVEGMGAPAQTNDATWQHRFFNTVEWVNDGGDFVAAASATQMVSGVDFYEWASTPELVADVQHWLTTPAENFGWALLGDESELDTAKRFDSRENGTASFRPQLLLDFEPVPPPALVGDANGDCSVGAADYAIWAAQFDQAGSDLAADFDHNGSVGAGDYALWAANFGNSCPPAGGNQSVPEPATWCLALAGLWGLLVWRR